MSGPVSLSSSEEDESELLKWNERLPRPLLRPQVQVDPDDLIPKLPKPRNLQPFPTTETIVNHCHTSSYSLCTSVSLQVYEGHTEMVRCVDIEPLGQWMASGESHFLPTHSLLDLWNKRICKFGW